MTNTATHQVLKLWREAASLTQRELALRLGKSVPYISRKEGGSRKLHAAEVASWGEACGMGYPVIERAVLQLAGLR